MSLYLREVLIVGIVVYFVLILFLLKKKALLLKYTLLWLLAGAIMAIMLFSPNLINILAHMLGIETPMYALFVIFIGFILCILMSLTSIVSRQRSKVKILVQQIGILEERLRDIEDTLK